MMVFMWTETCWSSFYNFNYFNHLRIYNLCALVGQWSVWSPSVLHLLPWTLGPFALHWKYWFCDTLIKRNVCLTLPTLLYNDPLQLQQSGCLNQPQCILCGKAASRFWTCWTNPYLPWIVYFLHEWNLQNYLKNEQSWNLQRNFLHPIFSPCHKDTFRALLEWRHFLCLHLNDYH